MNSSNKAMKTQVSQTHQLQDMGANELWTTLSDEQQEQVQGGWSAAFWAEINKEFLAASGSSSQNMPATA